MPMLRVTQDAEATTHLAPLRRPARPGAVPDVRGLFCPVRPEVADRSGLVARVVRVVRLTERPMAADGLVVDRHCPHRRELVPPCPLPHPSCGSKPSSRAPSGCTRPSRRPAGLILIRPSLAA